MLDESISFPTDCASLAIYDPDVAKSAGLNEVDSWEFEYEQIQAVKDGQITLAKLGGDGYYKLRITDGELTQDERDYAAYCLEPLGLHVESGIVSVSGYWFDSDLQLQIEPGTYWVQLYDISFWESPRWWTEELTTPDDAPADYVAVIKKCDQQIAIPSELHLDSMRNWEPGPTKFLFESNTRLIGPQIGMELNTTVRKSPNGLVLKQCGPGDYSAELICYDNLNRSDRIRFCVVSVDHKAKHVIGELVTKL